MPWTSSPKSTPFRAGEAGKVGGFFGPDPAGRVAYGLEELLVDVGRGLVLPVGEVLQGREHLFIGSLLICVLDEVFLTGRVVYTAQGLLNLYRVTAPCADVAPPVIDDSWDAC